MTGLGPDEGARGAIPATLALLDRLYCPFWSALNPGTEAAHRHTHAWAEAFGLCRGAKAQRQVASEQFTWLVGRFFPRAAPDVLDLISDFTSWLFWHDDVCDETTLGEDPTALARQFHWLFGVLTRRQEIRAGQPFDAAFADLRDRFEAAAPSPAWFARFVVSVQQYFDAGVWEAINRQDGVVPTVESFVGMRRFAGGMYIYLDFVELALGAELPLVVRGRRDVARLQQITTNVACWHNDLFSLPKELAFGDVHNLVVVIAKERTLNLAAATRAAMAECDREARAFRRLARQLPPFGPALDGLLARYLEGLGALMRGNLDWSRETARYRRHQEHDREAKTHAGPGERPPS